MKRYFEREKKMQTKTFEKCFGKKGQFEQGRIEEKF